MSLQRKIVEPKINLIEQTAADLCAQFYEVGRSQGLTSKHKTHKDYVAHNIEKFIPIALSYLMDMLNRPDISVEMKDTIYEAIIERNSDPSLNIFNQKYEVAEKKVGPLIIETPKIKQLFSDVAKRGLDNG
jgi:hypothetical protein